ncbi:MAG TPA: nucleotide disphospho-sugar-binding domain-containing protein [Stellaceae bacterium]|jgi:UDP:flavonoid glycosyltransferase YjiC (YdhE family)|nr:nucleotide disphospho-sugar-binding domain-containing protein [Stellaceae bacterium]
MAKFLWLNWSGGGNLPPSLGIARVLTEHGHSVVFAGRPEMVPRVQAAGFRAVELTQAYAQVDRYPANSPMQRAACYLTSPAVAQQVRDVVKAEAPDMLIFDGMFPAALAQARDFGKPTAAVSHTFVFRMIERWRGTINALIGMRQQSGFGPLPDLDALWHGCDRVLVTTLAEFDAAAPTGWDGLRHVGPVLEDEKVAVPTALPWGNDTAPLALMSFSTGFEQRSLDKLQRGLDAIADLPLYLVATTGGIVDPAELKAPCNAFVVNYAAHDPIIARAALVITHGGHGTAMRSLRHGVPMIVMPGLAHDQAVIANLMEEWGCGIAMPGDVPFGSAVNTVTLSREESVEALRDAVHKILATPSYRENAKKRAAMLAGIDGAANAAREIEVLLT